MDIFTKRALWDYWKLRSDKIEITNEKTSYLEETNHDDEHEIGEIFRIETNLFDYETPLCEKFKEFNYILKIDLDVLTKDIEGFKTYEDFKDNWIYEWNKDVPWVHKKPWTDTRVWTEPTLVVHYCEPFNYKNGCSEWPTCSWRDDRYCNRGNLPGAYIVGNTLHYQDVEWYEALKDCKLKEEALKNKAIMEELIEDESDESSYERRRRWDIYDDSNHDYEYEMHHEERYEEYVAVKEDEYDNLTNTSEDTCRAYQEIFRMLDEGGIVTRAERKKLKKSLA
ncbi:hypothetical protein Tco_0846748 [Tanacetum coccineum]